MAFKHLSVRESGSVVYCTMANPPTHTLVAPELEELRTLVRSLLERNDVRVVVFTGADEDIFITHYEVQELVDAAEEGRDVLPDSAAGNGDLHGFHKFMLDLQGAPFITVAAINGNAAGGGFEFALACDFRLQKQGDYLLGLPETEVGIIPGAGGTQRYARLLGTAKALDLILHGERLSPDQALELGLVSRVIEAAEYDKAVEAFATNLAGRAPIALAASKRAIYDGVDLGLEAGLAVEQAQFDRCMASRDAAVAMSSWLNDETWEWTGS